MKKYTIAKKYNGIGIILFIAIWQVLSMIVDERTFLLPSPIDTFFYLLHLLKSSYLYRCILTSLYKMLLGFFLSFGIAFVFGLLAGNSIKIKYLLEPFMTIFKSIPTASLVYLFILLAGVKMSSIYIVMLISMPILYEAIYKGISSTPHEFIEAASVDGANIKDINLRLRIPLSIPYIMIGVASSFSLSFKIEIMAEVITGSSMAGLGSAIVAMQRSDPSNMIPVFAYSIVAILVMLLFDFVSKIICKQFCIEQ